MTTRSELIKVGNWWDYSALAFICHVSIFPALLSPHMFYLCGSKHTQLSLFYVNPAEIEAQRLFWQKM